jgi:hypothetical protein
MFGPFKCLHFKAVPDVEDSRLHILNIFSACELPLYIQSCHVSLYSCIWLSCSKFFLPMDDHTRTLHEGSYRFSSPPEKEHCYACGREVTAGQMSRHLAYFPQCSVDMERSGKCRDDDGRRRKRRKKSYRVPSDYLSNKFENANCVDADDHSVSCLVDGLLTVSCSCQPKIRSP